VISREDFVEINALARAGVYQKDIAAQLGVSTKTVSRALQRGDAPKGEWKKRGTKLDAYHKQVDELMSLGVSNAMVVLREIQRAGYDGGITMLRMYMTPKRTLQRASTRATVRFETEPGRQMQSDWGTHRTVVKGIETVVHFCVNTLGYSRRFHFWCTTSQDAEHTYEGIVRAFEYFGGITEEVLVDNQKAAVLRPRGPAGEGAVFNPRFVDLAACYGFEPHACRPYRARTKGKDERMVGYVKHNFFERYREFESLTHMNQLAEQWLREEADRRFHRTVQEVVAERFERERPALQPLPKGRYDTAYQQMRMVDASAMIEVNGSRYSVPGRLAQQAVRIRITLDGELFVYEVSGTEAMQPVAMHRLAGRGGMQVIVEEHHAELWSRAMGEKASVAARELTVYEEMLA